MLAIGAAPPLRPHGYGLGFLADVPLAEASRQLRELGFPTSVATGATANGRSWAAVQVHGLLPDPFPLPTSAKPPGVIDRVTESAAGVLGKIPAVAKAAARNAGSSMVVVTEYRFDHAAWRAEAGEGPDVFSVEVGTGGHDWSKLPIESGPLLLRTRRPRGRPPDHPRGRRRLVQPRRRRVRVQLGGVIASELCSTRPQRRDVLVQVGHADQRPADAHLAEHLRLDAIDRLGTLRARLQLIARRDHDPVVVGEHQLDRARPARRRT